MTAKPRPYQGFGNVLTEALKRLAIQRKMKAVQADLAEELGYAARTIYAWRNGEHFPPPEAIEKMARIFVREGVADQKWLNEFLRKGEYGPIEAVITLNKELFGQVNYSNLGLGSHNEVESPKERTINLPEKRGFQNNFFVGALISWSNDFFRWSEASDHMRSSWTGLVIHALSVIASRATPRGFLIFCVSLLLGVITTRLITPVLQWPLEDVEARWMAHLQYGLATLLVPLLVALVTPSDRPNLFQFETVRQQFMFWILKFIGALVGFWVFSIIVIGLAMAWYYIHLPPLLAEFRVVLAMIPLFFSYVTARRIPLDRHKMFNGELRLHPADRIFLAVFTIAGPSTAIFLYYYYWFLANRTIAPIALVILFTVVALWEHRKRHSQAISDPIMTKVVEAISDYSQQRSVARNRRNREIMLKKVQTFWVEGVLESSLYKAVLLQLGIEYKPEMVDHPWDTVLQRPHHPDQLLFKNTKIVDIYDLFGGSFLILGEPGSGKTTALLELARDLITRARYDTDHPIPIVFNLSSWAESRKSLEDWLLDELNSKYYVPVNVAQEWINQDELLFLLDGLDEVKGEYRTSCVQIINQFHRRHMVNVIVCSRTDDYKVLTKKLALSGAIVQKPLSDKQIDEYLDSLGKRLSAVQTAIRADTSLQQLARSPLVLSIIALVYEGITLDDLRSGTLDERRDHLFARYVNRMFEHRRIRGRYTSDQIARGLVWLGKLMQRNAQTVFHIEHLQPSDLSGKAVRALYVRCFQFVFWILVASTFGFSCGLSIYYITNSLNSGIGAGLSYGIVGALGLWMAMTTSYQLKSRVWLGILFGWAIGITVWIFIQHFLISLALGLSTGLVTVFAFRRIEHDAYSNTLASPVLKINTSRKRLGWSWRNGLVGFRKRLPFGLVFGLAGGLTVGFPFGWTLGLAVGIALSLTVAVVGAISYGMVDINIEPISKPNEGILRSLENAIRFGSVSGIWLGIVLGYLVGLLSSPIQGIIAGCSFFIAGFVVAGIVAGGYPVLQHYILRILLHWNENVPLGYANFLNLAVYHIFLRRIGGGYIFIHRLLLEHFAEKALDEKGLTTRSS